jgi:hypothetical protein
MSKQMSIFKMANNQVIEEEKRTYSYFIKLVYMVSLKLMYILINFIQKYFKYYAMDLNSGGQLTKK